MKQYILLLFVITALTSKAQDTYFRVGNIPDYGKVDTFHANLLVATSYYDKRKVEGYVVLKETPKGCRRISFLTIYKKQFPRRFELLNYELK